MTSGEPMLASVTDNDVRAEAVERLEKKREFRVHLAAYLIVNAGLWAVWAIILATTDSWFPWPSFVVVGWGIGLALHAWDVYGNKPFTEEEIEREAARIGGR